MKAPVNIMLSIGVGAYNHEAFLPKCLDSILQQETAYSYEVVVFEYGSRDATAEIVSDYAARHPGIVRHVTAPTHRLMEILECMYGHFRGKFFALVDGDDYWTYPGKIDAQIRYLEEHPDCNGCFHDCAIESLGIKENLQSIGEHASYSRFNHYKKDFRPWDLLRRNIIPTSSFMSRTDYIGPFIRQYRGKDFLSLDWALELFCIRMGHFRYFDNIWSVYNDHAGGVSKSIPLYNWKLSNIGFLKSLLKDDYYRLIRKDVLAALYREYHELLNHPGAPDLPSGQWRSARRGLTRYAFLSLLSELRYFGNERKKTKH
jgi:glycosyltransferase involved in cell wall biosynthesis